MNQTLFDTPPKTQTEQLLRWFGSGAGITSFEAYQYLDITQLGARIKELEAKGYRFGRPRIKLPSGKIVCRYSLKR